MALKGNTVIELTDVHTGKKEIFEDENIVTNAVQKRFDEACSRSTFDSYGFNPTNAVPIQNTLMGGVIGFSVPVEENKDNYFMPANAGTKSVFYANIETISSPDKKRGSYNSIESGAIENGYKHVFDFNTAQGNGQVACICLCDNLIGANGPYGYTDVNKDDFWGRDFCESFSLPTTITNTSLSLVNYDSLRGEMVRCGYEPESRAFCILKQKINKLSNIGFLDSINSLTTISFEKVILSDVFPKGSGSPSLPCDYCNGKYYLVATLSAQTIRVAEIDEKTLGLIEKTININTPINNLYNRNAWISEGYLYTSSSDNKYLVKVSLSNGSDITTYPYGTVSSDVDEFFLKTPNGDLIFSDFVLQKDDGLYPYGYNYTGSSSYERRGRRIVDTKTLYEIYGNGDSTIRTITRTHRLTLQSINNLATPVVKTADKTMKITYIVREV